MQAGQKKHRLLEAGGSDAGGVQDRLALRLEHRHPGFLGEILPRILSACLRITWGEPSGDYRMASVCWSVYHRWRGVDWCTLRLPNQSARAPVVPGKAPSTCSTLTAGPPLPAPGPGQSGGGSALETRTARTLVDRLAWLPGERTVSRALGRMGRFLHIHFYAAPQLSGIHNEKELITWTRPR